MDTSDSYNDAYNDGYDDGYDDAIEYEAERNHENRLNSIIMLQRCNMLLCLLDSEMNRNAEEESGWVGRIPNSETVKRGPCSWFKDYLSENPVYPPHHFRQNFHIPLQLYKYIHQKLLEAEPKFKQRENAAGTTGHSSHQKRLSALRRLAEGTSFQKLDDKARMSKESCRYYFILFLDTMLDVFGEHYLNRHPDHSELREIARGYEESGFPGCIGCINCMHLKWKNCPKALKGLYRNPKDGRLATITCEAWCDSSLYCWHWFVGRCATNNDRTVMGYSPLLVDILNNERQMRLEDGYALNGIKRQWLLYFLVDGIYPDWAIFIGPMKAPTNEQEHFLKKRQEGRRKDIERFFGCLQGRFRILRNELFTWSDERIIKISSVCVILHNLIVEYTRNSEIDELDEDGQEVDCIAEFLGEGSENEENESAESLPMIPSRLDKLIEQSDIVQDNTRHIQLRTELASHLWTYRGKARS